MRPLPKTNPRGHQSYDNRDQLSLENGTAYTYDNNGNLTTKTGEATYTWDFENRLKHVALLDGTLVNHLYDADGNRVQTKVTPAGGGMATTTNYLVDTTGSLSQVVAESDGTGALTALYVRAYDELLAVLRPTGTSTWATRCVHADGLGSIRVLTDETGTVTDTRGYEAFGSRNVTAGTDPLAFGFAGEAFEGLSKLAYHRARWMDPRSGRFVSTDPLMGRVGNPLSLHKYLYAGAEPVDMTDPSGQEYDMASVGAEISIGSILSTMAQAGTLALGAAITCEASLVSSFFETASTSDRSNLCKKRWFNHYTDSVGFNGIKFDGEVKSSGRVYLTTEWIFSGAVAKDRLALPNPTPPVGFFRIPETSLFGLNHEGEAQPNRDRAGTPQNGGGDEWTAESPVSIVGAVWFDIGE